MGYGSKMQLSFSFGQHHGVCAIQCRCTHPLFCTAFFRSVIGKSSLLTGIKVMIRRYFTEGAISLKHLDKNQVLHQMNSSMILFNLNYDETKIH